MIQCQRLTKLEIEFMKHGRVSAFDQENLKEAFCQSIADQAYQLALNFANSALKAKDAYKGNDLTFNIALKIEDITNS